MAPDQSALGLLRGLSQRQPLLHQTFPLPICLCPHPFISASASSSVLASDSPSCSIRFCSPFYPGILFSVGVPPQRPCFSSPPTFQQLEAESTLTMFLLSECLFNSRVYDSTCNIPSWKCSCAASNGYRVAFKIVLNSRHCLAPFRRLAPSSFMVRQKQTWVTFSVFGLHGSQPALASFAAAQLSDHIKPQPADVYLWFPWRN